MVAWEMKRNWKWWKNIALAVVNLKEHEGWGEGGGQVAPEEVREGVGKTLDNFLTMLAGEE
jgi:hypothetical protein